MSAAEAFKRSEWVALERLSEELGRGGTRVDPGVLVSLAEIRVHGLSIACHPVPWNGPLHICVPADGPCKEIGPADRPAEVAAVVRGMVARAG